MYLKIKRIFDIILSASIFIFLIPLLIIIIMTIKFESKGKAIYKQTRVGINKTEFIIYKFRTMYKDAETTIPIWSKKNDSRVTGVGKILRPTNLDELPQLINIFLGTMSFIGPRPERPFFVKKFRKNIPNYDERFKVKPGLTGLSQISGLFGDTSIIKRTKKDLLYVQNQSFFLDIKIIFFTIKKFLRNLIYITKRLKN